MDKTLQRTASKVISKRRKAAKPAPAAAPRPYSDAAFVKACAKCVKKETYERFEFVFGVMWSEMTGVASAEGTALVKAIGEAMALDGAPQDRKGALRFAAKLFLDKRGDVGFSDELRMLASTAALVEMGDDLGTLLENVGSNMEEEEHDEAEYMESIFVEWEESCFGMDFEAAEDALNAHDVDDEDFVDSLQKALEEVGEVEL